MTVCGWHHAQYRPNVIHVSADIQFTSIPVRDNVTNPYSLQALTAFFGPQILDKVCTKHSAKCILT